MYNTLKFTGKFADLKDKGYKFQKLYAANYKCYSKETDNFSIWVWQKNSCIEIDDLYSSTKQFVEIISKIDWSTIDNFAYVWYSHTDKSLEMKICNEDTYIATALYVRNNHGYDNLPTREKYNELKKAALGEYTRSVYIDKEKVEAILEELKNIQ